MLPVKSVMLLALGSLLWMSCARLQVAPVRLDESRLPDCLVEEPPKAGQVVGALEFEPAWLAATVALSRQGKTAEAVQRALDCGSAIGKTLREDKTSIRLNNRP